MGRRTQLLVAALLVLVTVGYGVFQARSYLTGPSLQILEPKNGATITAPTYTVRGTTDRAAHVRLGGRTIPIDPKGAFREKLVTPDGFGTFEVAVTDRFGRTVRERIELYGVAPEFLAATSSEATTTRKAETE